MADYSYLPEELQGKVYYYKGKLVAECQVCGAIKQTSGKADVLRKIERGEIDKLKFCYIHGSYKSGKPSAQDIASWPKDHKRCKECLEVKPFSEFHKHAQALFGYGVHCKECRKPMSQRTWADRDYTKKMFDRAKGRASRNGRQFTISIDDIVIPDNCPVLGVPLVLTPGSPYVPSLDRKDSDRGYTPDNIVVMSRRANTLKNNMTLEECRSLLNYLEGGSI